MKTTPFIITLFAASLLASGGNARTKMLGRDILKLEQFRLRVPGKDNIKKSAGKNAEVTVVVSLKASSDVATLSEAGFHVVSSRGNVAVVSLPIERMDALSKLDCVVRISVGREASLTTNVQREMTGLDKMLVSLPGEIGLPLRGEGVVTGIFDQGFDFNHVNFLDNEGEKRIKAFWKYTSDNGKSNKYTGFRLSALGTDDESITHGTHTLGIMAGGYEREIEHAFLPSHDAGEALFETALNPYKGVAPASEIVAAAGALYMPNILDGVEKMIDYAKNEGKPAVINLSIGLQEGSHDGLDPESMYLSELGKEALIVIAAGNDGMKENCITHHFTEDAGEVKTLILAPGGTGYGDTGGNIDIWGSSDAPFEVDLVIFDLATRKISKTFPLKYDTEGHGVYLTTSDLGDYYGEWHDNTFDHNFVESYVVYASGVHEENGRFNLYVQYGLTHARSNSTSKMIGFAMRGPAGTQGDIYCYSEDSAIGSKDIKGWSNPTSCGTINDMACADNVLVVGSYNNRENYGSLSGRVTWLTEANGMGKEGAASGYSSYGYRLDGTPLPHVCAPGAGVVSSFSTPYVEFFNLSEGYMSARTIDESRNNYWNVQSGTSMAAPFVSGVVALWLQALPELTIDQVKEAVAATSIVDDDVINTGNEVKWGAGKINPEGGLRYILEHFTTSVGSIEDENSSDNLILLKSDDGYDVYLKGESNATISVFNLAGNTVSTYHYQGGLGHISTAGFQPGVYLVNVSTTHGNISKKIMVRG